jgi:beta-lactamase regulating signal transducer with metallopeptidase domain
MNNWLSGLSIHTPAALTILFVTTALLIVGLAVQHSIRRSPAARHTVLLWALIAVGLCPILIPLMRLAAIPTPKVGRIPVQRINVLLGGPSRPQTTHNSSASNEARHLPLGGFLLGLWATGAFISLLGLARGLRITRQIMSSAQPIPADRIESVRVSCSKSLATISRRYVFQIRSGFRWRSAMFGPSSCFRHRY